MQTLTLTGSESRDMSSELFRIHRTSKDSAQVSFTAKEKKKKRGKATEKRMNGKKKERDFLCGCLRNSNVSQIPTVVHETKRYHFFEVDCDSSRTRFCSSSAFISRTFASTT